MKVFRLSAVALAGATLTSIHGTAYAQSQVPGPDSAADQTSGGIGDIVVTARKRVENLREVPVSVAVLGSKQLTQAKITQIYDLTTRVPNLTISAASNLPTVLIRGFGTGSNLSFEQAVGKFIDNVSYGRDQDLRLPLFDVERLEVLRGPQVLLYGNSATAGALNITTKKPGDTLSVDASVAYNFSYDEVVSQAGVTLPITDGLSLRVSGIYQYRDKGPVFNILTNRSEPQLRNYAGRVILQAKPTDRLTVTLKAEYDRTNDRGNSGEIRTQPVFGILGPLADATADGRKAANSDRAPFFQPEFLAVRNVTYQGDAVYDVGGGQVTSTTAYRELAVAQSLTVPVPINLLDAFLSYDYHQFSQELRYAGSFGPADLVVGGYYQRDTFDVRSAIGFNLSPTIPGNPPIPPFAANAGLDQVQKSYSLFGDLTYHLTDNLSIEAGGRYTWIRKNADQFAVPGMVVTRKTLSNRKSSLSPFAPFEPLFVQGLGVPSHNFTDLKYRDGFFQPQVVLQYKPSDTAQFFAKYVKGSKAGGFDYFYTGFAPVGPVRDNADFAAETAESFELGTKGLIFDRKLEYSLVLFRTTFTDLQASQFETATFVVTNVGKARTQGIELDLTYVPFNGLRLGVSGAYLDAKYLDYPGQPCTVGQLVANGSASGCSQDLSGAPTQYSSKWTGTFNVDYRWSLNSGWNMAAGMTLFARSKYNASTNNEPLLVQKGFARIDGHVDLISQDDRFNVSVFGRNLTDKKTLEFGNQAALTGSAISGFSSLGREIGVRFGMNF